MSESLELFPAEPQPERERGGPAHVPLAERLRPASWDQYRGLEAIDPVLMQRLRAGAGVPPSLMLWGPPGSGKTTLARLIGRTFPCRFVEASAVLVGVKEVREIVAEAKRHPRSTILFIDEIHRFNKAQQDAFLPHIENGSVILIGATTENPSFYLTAALLSRARVVVLPPLDGSAIEAILARAGEAVGVNFAPEAREVLCRHAGGDARRLLNVIERIAAEWSRGEGAITITELRRFLGDTPGAFYDRAGEQHYNMVSAFIKSMRGSDPDAALYWGFRMLEGGEDPRFLIRRMMIFASEDVGNADPRALTLAVATADAFDRLGVPEGHIPIAHCITYLASAPKSNRSYLAMHAAVGAVRRHQHVEVPVHLRNAPTKLMSELGYGADYRYPHDTGGFAAGVQYLPQEIVGERFYEPAERGYELRIRERLAALRGVPPSPRERAGGEHDD